jgi:acetyl esterase
MEHRMLIRVQMVFAVLTLLYALPTVAGSQDNGLQPSIRTFKTVGKAELKAYVFMPTNPANWKLRPAIVLLHGGGWTIGDPDWMFEDAKRYAGLGMVAIAGEYRLSDQKNVTPLEAMADTRDLIRWVRENAADLRVDPDKIAAYGVSAGAHLAAAAAVFPHQEENKISAVPDALILLSPPVSLINDRWPQMLMGTRADVKDISPAENIKKQLPPMLIIEGAADTVAPLVAVQAFCERAKKVGGMCELQVYPRLGHILSRNLDAHAQEEGPFDPDPAAVAKAHAQEDAFLVRIGYAK